MFEDAIQRLEYIRSEFTCSVRDSVGKSIDDRDLSDIRSDLQNMVKAYGQMQEDVTSIRVLTERLRMLTW